ncbi:HalOD1 output domain-containing protein [Haladaptatus pallidirubidus]|uniref:Halobacterial output domain-containing protein n=1 Tax=Haladaptatus pallidirubidus TaxID=1008152 RepID=A0AAV3UJ67_9EURY|nr:HalOD1 output domain-containing protein [Haladaptatus pallidirubidus]
MTTHNTSQAPSDSRDASDHPLTHPSAPLTDRIVTAVANAADCSRQELAPLYEVVDPDALNSLFAPTYSGGTQADGRVHFAYSGYEVVIHSTGDVNVSLLDAAGE